jgi:hypothetical protein
MSAFGPLRHFAATQPFGRYRINNGQTAQLGLTGSAAFGPERTNLERQKLPHTLRPENHKRSFFRKPGLAQAIDNDRWGRILGQKPFDCELRVETTRLR